MGLQVTAAALLGLLCLQIHTTGAVPIGAAVENHQQESPRAGEQEPQPVTDFLPGVIDIADTGARNENPVCEIFPVTNDPLPGTKATPAPAIINEPGLDTHQETAPVAPPVPNPPNTPSVDHYNVPPPHNPVSGGPFVYGPPLTGGGGPFVYGPPLTGGEGPFVYGPPVTGGEGPFVYGQGADYPGFVPAGGQIPPYNTPLGANGVLPGTEWVLVLDRDGRLPMNLIPQGNGGVVHNPMGNHGGLSPGQPVLIPKFTSTSSELSSEEDD